MSLQYNENGDLQYFTEIRDLVVCPNCNKPYHQFREEQVPGFRDMDYDICPYCHHENNHSMTWEFSNYPLSEDEVAKYFQANPGDAISADS